jgi:8-oxo-dGTP diphosphatase
MDMEQDYTVFTESLRFCPRCGGALESRLLKATEPERLVCTQCGFVHYIDPKVAVGTIISDEQGRIVLVRRAIEPGYGKWVFPGGFIDRGETVEAAALREAREECGLDIRLDSLLNIYSYPGVAVIIIAFAATVLGGCLECDDESLEAQLFERDQIPWEELAFRSTKEALEEFFAGGPDKARLTRS